MTMKQLAELAGIDASTVSRALRGDSRRVAASTIERVQMLARETGYIPNPTAASLRSGRSRMLGVLVPVLSDIVMGILATAIEEESRELGYLAIVIATHGDSEVRSRAVDRLLSRKVDGLVLCDTEVGREVPPPLSASGIPYLFAMRGCETAMSVTADDHRGGALVAEHFVAAGHREMAVVPGPATARTAIDRMAGFMGVMALHPGIRVFPNQGGGGFGVDDGYRYVISLLATDARPTALFCTNDHTAIGAAHALADHGLRVGHDVALVGYNDIPQAAYLEPPLSSVRTDLSVMGKLAARHLVDLIDGRSVTSLVLEPALMVRASSETAVAGRPVVSPTVSLGR